MTTYLPTLIQMEDEAYELGAASVRLIGFLYLKVTDDGEWFIDEKQITREEAGVLRDHFSYDA